MLDVLLYLYELYIGQDKQVYLSMEKLAIELTDAGFDDEAVGKALDWLDDLVMLGGLDHNPAAQTKGVRVFTAHESRKLTLESRGFLYLMEQVEILDPVTREVVIDRAMALDSALVSLSQLKCVLAMVLMSQPDSIDKISWFYNTQWQGTIKNWH